MSTDTHASENRVAILQQRMAEHAMAGHWESRTRHPDLEPIVWKWPLIHSFLQEAGEVVALGRADEANARRTVNLISPALGSYKATSRTLQMSVQLIKPEERAEAHRHTEALRFVVESTGAYTTVNGERLIMEPGDLLLTPTMAWHDHYNPTTDHAIWLDVLAGPLTRYLNASYSEMFPEGTAQPITKPDGYSRRRYETMRPRVTEGESVAVPYAYKWSEALAALQELNEAGESDPHDGVMLEYTNPVTGGPTMPIIGCWVQMLRPGEQTRAHRHMGTTIAHVVGGEGTTEVGRGAESTRLEWNTRDCFLLPSWQWHQHRNASSTEPAFIFSVTDRPVLEALGVYRVEKS